MKRFLFAVVCLLPGVAWGQQGVAINPANPTPASIGAPALNSYGLITPAQLPYVSALLRAPKITDDLTVGCVVGANWIYAGKAWTAQSCAAGQAHWVPISAIALPLDTVPGVTAYGWGTRKLRAAYAGSALTLSNTTATATTATIGFLADGSMDGASIDAYNSTYATSYVSTWNEQSTSAYSAVAPAAANGPIAPAANIVGNARSVVFNSVANALPNQAATQKYLSFPTLAWTPSTSTVFVVAQHRDTEHSRTMLETPSSALQFLSSYITTSTVGRLTFSPSKGNCGVAPEAGPSVLGIAWNGTSSICASNAVSSTGVMNTATAATGGNLGSASSGFPGTLDADAFVIFPSVLSAANFSAEMLSLEVLFNIQPQADTVVVSDGDSTTAGTGSVQDSSYPKLGIPLLNRPVRFYNTAIHGYAMCGTPSGMAARAGYIFTNLYSATARDFVVHIMGGENDFRQGTTAAAVEACLQTYVNTVHGLGSNVRLVVATEPLKCDILANATELASQQAYNTWIKANAFIPQASGGLGLTAINDAIDDVEADPVVGPASYTVSAFCSSPPSGTSSLPNANSPDGIHPTDSLMGVMAVPFAASVNGVLH